jgi:threonine dehydrogenase-like Zn-dependent dehydrogenase
MLEERETVVGARVTRLSGTIETTTTLIAGAGTIDITFTSTRAIVQAALAVAVRARPSRFTLAFSLTVTESVFATSMLEVGSSIIIIIKDTVRGFRALGFRAVRTPESRATMTFTFHAGAEFFGLAAVVGTVLQLALIPMPAQPVILVPELAKAFAIEAATVACAVTGTLFVVAIQAHVTLEARVALAQPGDGIAHSL